MTNYNLNIVVDEKILAMHSEDSLCIAKKVNGNFNVIFQGASPIPKPDQQLLVSNNTFQWTDEYQVYLTASYGNGVLIHQSSNQVPIAFGESAIFKDGSLQEAITADTSDWDLADGSGVDQTFVVDGAPTSLHAAVAQSTGGGKFSTIYVDPDIHMAVSRIELTPLNQYLVFWRKITTTEAMLAIATGHGHTWSFALGKTEKTIRFGYGVPNQPKTATEAPGWYDQ
jgi:hypothetical protein